MAEKRIKTGVSQTASYTCFCRACASAEPDERFRGPDTIAGKFVPFLPTVLFLKCNPLRKLTVRRIMPRGIYEYVTARTRVFDAYFSAALDEAVPQIVILGAGFDTRAWRFASRNRGTRIYELDSPVTQAMKKKLLAENGFPVPERLTFVPVDLEEQDLAAALDAAGYQPGLKGLFLMEGVTMYLVWRSVDRTLYEIRTGAAAGSRIAFDYVLASVLRRENSLYGEAAITRRVFKTGERWTFGIEQGTIGRFLADRGFDLAAHYAPADLQRKYLTAEDGTMYGRINETHCIAIAAVGKNKNNKRKRSQ